MPTCLQERTRSAELHRMSRNLSEGSPSPRHVTSRVIEDDDSWRSRTRLPRGARSYAQNTLSNFNERSESTPKVS